MKLYKFKSLDGESLGHVKDTVLNNRLYCGTADQMNDIEEGGFIDHTIAETMNNDEFSSARDKVDRLVKIIESTRFCSMCPSPVQPLLWAHYAGGYKGIALEYDIPEDDPAIDLVKIGYSKPPELTLEIMDLILEKRIKIYDHGILGFKRKDWAYEEEHRIFLNDTSTPYYNIKPTAFIMGISKLVTRAQLELLDACRIAKLKIKILNFPYNGEGLTIHDP